MGTPRIEIGKIRREQITAAAVAVIAEEGLQGLSLSAIEKRTGMSRGQLTYYFSAKEDILLAVFDRLLLMLHERAHAADGGDSPCKFAGSGWERLQAILTMFVLDPPPMLEFHSLQYTFLSQIGHRADFRLRLANLYAEWRQHMEEDIAPELALRGRPVSPGAFATLVQAILHGLAVQRAADPGAFDRKEMLNLCLELLGNFLHPPALNGGPERRPARKKAPANSAGARGAGRHAGQAPRVKHE